MLPDPVLERMQAELLDWQGSGMSVMEVSHRGSAFIEFAAQSEKNLRELLGVPANYKVLFLQGGATLQFAAVPLNLAPPGSVVDYVGHGQLEREGRRRGQALRRRQRRREQLGDEVHDDSRSEHVEAVEERGLLALRRRTRRCSASSSTTCRRCRTRRS